MEKSPVGKAVRFISQYGELDGLITGYSDTLNKYIVYCYVAELNKFCEFLVKNVKLYDNKS